MRGGQVFGVFAWSTVPSSSGLTDASRRRRKKTIMSFEHPMVNQMVVTMRINTGMKMAVIS